MGHQEPYFAHWNDSVDLAPFSHYLREVGALKFSGISPHSLDMHYNEGIELNFVIKGTYKWIVEGKRYQLFPGEAFVTCPWEWHGSPDEVLDRGVLSWMILQPRSFSADGRLDLGDWSRLGPGTQADIGRLLAENTNPVIPKGSNLIGIFRKLHAELVHKELGHEERINLLLDSLLIKIARLLQKRKTGREREDAFTRELRERMTASFTERVRIADLAYCFGMCATTFNNKVKALTGFSPADYMIELKLEKAREMLALTDELVTTISVDCGFYSSQHFAAQFAARVGMTPSQYRKQARKTAP